MDHFCAVSGSLPRPPIAPRVANVVHHLARKAHNHCWVQAVGEGGKFVTIRTSHCSTWCRPVQPIYNDENCFVYHRSSIQVIALLNSDSEAEDPLPFRSDASASLEAASWQAPDAPGASPFEVRLLCLLDQVCYICVVRWGHDGIAHHLKLFLIVYETGSLIRFHGL